MKENSDQILEKLTQAGIPIFEGLGKEDIKDIIKLGYTIDFSPGDLVIRKDNTASTMYILLNGSLEIRDGNLVVRHVTPGEIIGELALLLSSPRSADVFAGGEGAIVLCLNEDNLQARLLSKLHPGAFLLLNLSRIIAQKLAAATRNLRHIQQQLVQQEKLASLGQLTSGIAHELKNPLNFVNNFATLNRELSEELLDTLDAEPDVDQLKDTLELIKTNSEQTAKHGQRANAIVESMMLHALPNTGKKEWLNLKELLKAQMQIALQRHETQHGKLSISIDFDFASPDLKVFVSPQEITKVLQNILTNAIEAVEKKIRPVSTQYEPAIRIKTQKNDDTTIIEIFDNGPCLSQEAQKKIFEPFYTTKPTGSGIGLGLSLSYDIITQGHGGTLSVESQQDQGAIFTITLPSNPA